MLVIGSPFMLDLFGGTVESWARRGIIAETYGAGAALLSALALVGIMISLAVQSSDAKVSRRYNQRDTHMRLLEMALNNSLYLECWEGEIYDADELDRVRQLVYINLVVSFWADQYEVGNISYDMARRHISRLFETSIGLRYWTRARATWLERDATRREYRFHMMVEEQYKKAMTNRDTSQGIGGFPEQKSAS